MLKRLAILAVMVVSVVACAKKPFPMKGNDQQNHTQNETHATDPLTPTTTRAKIDQENAENAERYAYYKAHPKEYFETAFAPANLSNWILAVLGVIGAAVAVVTVFIVKRQTQHMVTSERAWVTVNPTDLHPKLYPAWEQGTPFTSPQFLTPPVHHQLGLAMTNAGKTPAQIDELACRYIRIASMEELPAEPEYGKFHPQGGHWVVPDDKYYGIVDLETDSGVLYERHIQELKSRISFLFVFGILKYRDAFGNSRETRFGFHYEFPIPGTVAADGSELIPCFRKIGLGKYTRAT